MSKCIRQTPCSYERYLVYIQKTYRMTPFCNLFMEKTLVQCKSHQRAVKQTHKGSEQYMKVIMQNTVRFLEKETDAVVRRRTWMLPQLTYRTQYLKHAPHLIIDCFIETVELLLQSRDLITNFFHISTSLSLLLLTTVEFTSDLLHLTINRACTASDQNCHNLTTYINNRWITWANLD